MAVYSSFGGMPDLLDAVIDHGYRMLAERFSRAPRTGDAVADVFILALTHRAVARENPHLYDLMFGLSSRGAYRAIELDPVANVDGRSAAYQATYTQLVAAAERLIEAGRIRKDSSAVIAAQLWSFIHGFVSLELAGHMVQFDDCVQQVLLPLGVNMAVGLGDTPTAASQSIAAATKALKSVKRRTVSTRH